MPEEIRLWKVEQGDSLKECLRSNLDLEARLEVWLEKDVSILAPDLLVIGRQVETEFGGFIDLLCINEVGDLAILELKRRKTPREVTAQALDYASWVSDLSSERIEPSRVEYQTRTSRTSKRLPNLTYEELERIAESNGVLDLYTELVSRLTPVFHRGTTQSSMAFAADIDGSRKTVFSLIPQESSAERGLRFQLYFQRTATALGLAPEKVLDLLPGTREDWKYYGTADSDYSGYAGFFRTLAEIARFTEGMTAGR